MKLLSWNVQWGRDASGVVDLARTVREAQRLADFDVLCLQEVTRGFHALPGGPGDDQYAELAELLPGYTVIEAIGADLPAAPAQRGVSPADKALRRQFGNALVTRLPVQQVFRRAFRGPPIRPHRRCNASRLKPCSTRRAARCASWSRIWSFIRCASDSHKSMNCGVCSKRQPITPRIRRPQKTIPVRSRARTDQRAR